MDGILVFFSGVWSMEERQLYSSCVQGHEASASEKTNGVSLAWHMGGKKITLQFWSLK